MELQELHSLSVVTQKRKRRSPEAAREEILQAAESILLSQGPSHLKFQLIAKTAGLSQSNVHHHFGGVVEIKSALITRMLQHLTLELGEALNATAGDDRETRISGAIKTAYSVLSTERYSKLVAWLVLASNTDQIADLAAPLRIIEEMIVENLKISISAERAKLAAPRIIYQVAIAAVGEGLIGGLLRPALGENAQELDGSQMLIDMVLKA